MNKKGESKNIKFSEENIIQILLKKNEEISNEMKNWQSKKMKIINKISEREKDIEKKCIGIKNDLKKVDVMSLEILVKEILNYFKEHKEEENILYEKVIFQQFEMKNNLMLFYLKENSKLEEKKKNSKKMLEMSKKIEEMEEYGEIQKKIIQHKENLIKKKNIKLFENKKNYYKENFLEIVNSIELLKIIKKYETQTSSLFTENKSVSSEFSKTLNRSTITSKTEDFKVIMGNIAKFKNYQKLKKKPLIDNFRKSFFINEGPFIKIQGFSSFTDVSSFQETDKLALQRAIYKNNVSEQHLNHVNYKHFQNLNNFNNISNNEVLQSSTNDSQFNDDRQFNYEENKKNLYLHNSETTKTNQTTTPDKNRGGKSTNQNFNDEIKKLTLNRKIEKNVNQKLDREIEKNNIKITMQEKKKTLDKKIPAVISYLKGIFRKKMIKNEIRNTLLKYKTKFNEVEDEKNRRFLKKFNRIIFLRDNIKSSLIEKKKRKNSFIGNLPKRGITVNEKVLLKSLKEKLKRLRVKISEEISLQRKELIFAKKLLERLKTKKTPRASKNFTRKKICFFEEETRESNEGFLSRIFEENKIFKKEDDVEEKKKKLLEFMDTFQKLKNETSAKMSVIRELKAQVKEAWDEIKEREEKIDELEEENNSLLEKNEELLLDLNNEKIQINELIQNSKDQEKLIQDLQERNELNKEIEKKSSAFSFHNLENKIPNPENEDNDFFIKKIELLEYEIIKLKINLQEKINKISFLQRKNYNENQTQYAKKEDLNESSELIVQVKKQQISFDDFEHTENSSLYFKEKNFSKDKNFLSKNKNQDSLCIEIGFDSNINSINE